MSKNYPYLDKVRFNDEIEKATVILSEGGIKNYDPRCREQFQDEMMEWYQFGSRISKDELLKLRDDIISMAEEEGFPDRKPSDKSEGTTFDRKLAEFLYSNLDITPSMASDIEMWAYLNIILIPDVVTWRWLNKGVVNPERFILPTRNYLGSLWWSYVIYRYDSNDSDKYDTISADQFAGFFERTNSRGLPNYIHKFVLFLEKQASIDHKKVENDVIREMNKLLKIEFAYRDYLCLSEEEIDALLYNSYDKAMKIVNEKKEVEKKMLAEKAKKVVIKL